MTRGWISIIGVATAFFFCNPAKPVIDGFEVETEILASYNLAKDYADSKLLLEIIRDINCADSALLGKNLVMADQFHSADTSEILLIPFKSNGKTFQSSAYSKVDSRFVLINLEYIKEFALANTLSDSSAYQPLVSLMLLHEIGHFVLGASGAFDKLESVETNKVGEHGKDDTTPEYLTSIKKVELAADSIVIDLVKQALARRGGCLYMAFDVERVLPGMQFQISGRRMLENFGRPGATILRDPSNDHPNLELRITFMNYFLFRNPDIKRMVDNYLYNRTVVPIHAQEFDPRIFQGSEKEF